jgi:hypothetical protein
LVFEQGVHLCKGKKAFALALVNESLDDFFCFISHGFLVVMRVEGQRRTGLGLSVVLQVVSSVR